MPRDAGPKEKGRDTCNRRVTRVTRVTLVTRVTWFETDITCDRHVTYMYVKCILHHITSYYMYLDVTYSISLIHFFSFGPMAGVPTQTIYFLYDLYDFVYQSYRIVSYIFPQGSRLTCWPSGRV